MWCVDCMAKWYCIIFLLDIVLEKDENLDVVSPTERTKKDDMMKTNDAMKTDGAIGKDVVVGDQWLNHMVWSNGFSTSWEHSTADRRRLRLPAAAEGVASGGVESYHSTPLPPPLAYLLPWIL